MVTVSNSRRHGLEPSSSTDPGFENLIDYAVVELLTFSITMAIRDPKGRCFYLDPGPSYSGNNISWPELPVRKFALFFAKDSEKVYENAF